MSSTNNGPSKARQALGLAAAGLLALPTQTVAYPMVLPGGGLTETLVQTGFPPFALEDIIEAQATGPGDNFGGSDGGGGQGFGNSGEQESYSDRHTANTTATPQNATTLSDRQTAVIVALITDGKTFCIQVPWQYRVDCLRFHLEKAANATPTSKDYAPVRKALAKAARDLGKIRNKYADRSAPRQAFASPNGKKRVPALQAVRAENRAAIARETDRVLQETNTVLLRSAADDQDRLRQYTRVSQAVDSTKVLLRSA